MKKLRTMKSPSSVNKLITKTLAGVAYCIHPQILIEGPIEAAAEGLVEGDISSKDASSDYLPATVITVTENVRKPDDIFKLFQQFRAEDDVFSNEFQRILILQGLQDDHFSRLIDAVHSAKDFDHIFRMPAVSNPETIPNGPYFIGEDGIHQAWRLYEDDLDAFIIPTVPEDVAAPDK